MGRYHGQSDQPVPAIRNEIKMMQTAETNAQRADQLLSLNA